MRGYLAPHGHSLIINWVVNTVALLRDNTLNTRPVLFDSHTSRQITHWWGNWPHDNYTQLSSRQYVTTFWDHTSEIITSDIRSSARDTKLGRKMSRMISSITRHTECHRPQGMLHHSHISFTGDFQPDTEWRSPKLSVRWQQLRLSVGTECFPWLKLTIIIPFGVRNNYSWHKCTVSLYSLPYPTLPFTPSAPCKPTWTLDPTQYKPMTTQFYHL